MTITALPGESGYFSDPTDSLDPHLFAGDQLRADVRTWILGRLGQHWHGRLRGAEKWCKVWIAGSGATYQWSAGRGNGDLDILLGVDLPYFWKLNPQYAGFSEDDTAALINQDLHDGLWPATAEQNINGKVYEVTWYVNPRGTDIRDIHAYAAYNVTDNEWTVRPPQGDDFNHPAVHFDAAEREAGTGWNLVRRYNEARTDGERNLVASQISTLYDDIHLGRKNAFSSLGHGYGDYFNFRWQYHKRSGLVQTLHAVAAAHNQRQDSLEEQLYGGPIEGANVLLRRAALHARGIS